jgi:hypothetical protein
MLEAPYIFAYIAGTTAVPVVVVPLVVPEFFLHPGTMDIITTAIPVSQVDLINSIMKG